MESETPEVKTTPVPRSALIFIGILVAALLVNRFVLNPPDNEPAIDPAPQGEGSFEEADAMQAALTTWFETQDKGNLPEGYALTEYPDGSWVLCYATGSHKKTSGGTLGILDNTGALSIHFGHNCKDVDSGDLAYADRFKTRELFMANVEEFYTLHLKEELQEDASTETPEEVPAETPAS